MQCTQDDRQELIGPSVAASRASPMAMPLVMESTACAVAVAPGQGHGAALNVRLIDSRGMTTRAVVILGMARTPIGKYGGAFRDLHPAALGAVAVAAALDRANLAPADVESVWMGHGRQAGSGPNPARQVAHRSGIPYGAPAQTINKACASGMQAIASAAQEILLGEAEVVVAGGIESMSRMPYLVDSVDARWGHKMGHFPFVDAMYRDGFHCPLADMIMGETAEVLAGSTASRVTTPMRLPRRVSRKRKRRNAPGVSTRRSRR
jgi:hypothetical protein